MKARTVALLAIGSATSLTAGCSGPQWYMTGVGPAANTLAALGWFALLTFLVTVVVMWVLIGAIALRPRGSFAEHAAPDTGGGMRWVLYGGFIAPVAVLFVIYVATLQTMAAFPMEHAPSDPEIRVIGRQWWWEAEYLEGGKPVANSPTEIHIPVGRPVQIELQSRDVIHSFWVPKIHGKVDAIPGMTNYLRIQANEPGVYRGECAEFCGMQHAHMILYVVAHPEAEYRAWIEHLRRPAAPATTTAAGLGEQVFMRAACPLCHTVQGTKALATIGPDLTHLASRGTIAGGMLPNTRGNLQAWVTHAQSLKPGSRMPDLTTFTGEELNALVDYLQTLK